MKALVKIFVVASLLTFTSVAQSGFLLEPYLNQSISGEATDSDPTNTLDADASHLLYGARVGWMTMMGLMLGVDVQLGQGKWEFNGGGEVDTSMQDLGAFIGYQTMMGFRFFLSYMFQNKTTLEYTNQSDAELSGSGFKLGVGYTFMNFGAPWFAINAEYHTNTFDECEQTNGCNGNLTYEVDQNAILLGVSFPIDFAVM